MTQSEQKAIEYAHTHEDGLVFLQFYFSGNFDAIRQRWPDCPTEIYSPKEIKLNNGVVYSLTTKVILLNCPHCRNSQDKVLGDPRGKRFVCERCDKEFMVAEAAELAVA